MAEIIERGAPLSGGDRILLEMRRLQIDRDSSRAAQAKQIDELMSPEPVREDT